MSIFLSERLLRCFVCGERIKEGDSDGHRDPRHRDEGWRARRLQGRHGMEGTGAHMKRFYVEERDRRLHAQGAADPERKRE